MEKRTSHPFCMRRYSRLTWSRLISPVCCYSRSAELSLQEPLAKPGDNLLTNSREDLVRKAILQLV
jgi:hypothetical protein